MNFAEFTALENFSTVCSIIEIFLLIGEVKTLLIQLLKAVHHLHDNWIIHRDLKTSNLLLSHKGILKVHDQWCVNVLFSFLIHCRLLILVWLGVWLTTKELHSHCCDTVVQST